MNIINGKLIIPEGTKLVASSDFSLRYDNNKRLIREIQFPESLQTISSFCFQGCNYLEKVDIPGNVKTIGMYAFSDCNWLESVTIRKGVKNLEAAAFQDCTNLK